MKNKYKLTVAFMLIAVLLLQFASAGVGYQQYSTLYDSTNITRIYLYIQRGSSFGIYPTTLCFFSWCYSADIDYSDEVPMGLPFQFYIQYGLMPIGEWNTANPNSNIDYCSILVKESHFAKLKNGSIVLSVKYTLNRTFTADDTSTMQNQYRHFISLERGDYAEVFADCHFTGANQTMNVPIQLNIVTPTKNCKACQYYESFISSFDDVVGDAIDDYSSRIQKNIKLFIGWNFEILSLLFWIAKIILLISVIGAIFLGFWWVWKFIEKMARRWG